MRLKNKLIRDVMSREVATVQIGTTAKQIAASMNKEGISAMVVTGQDGEAMGIISDIDMLKAIGNENWQNMKAESLMTSHIEAVRPTMTIEDAAKMMMEKHNDWLLIFSERGMGASQRPVGILSPRDIVREAVQA